MYLNAALLAVFALLYALVSGRVERSRLSGPIVFVLAGLLLGPASGVLALKLSVEDLRVLAELTLAVVLFCDAANADFARIRHSSFLPRRLLLIGLPLTVILGFLAAWALFPGLALIEVALIAAILAPTDAALGKPVVTNPEVPPDTREALNFESGLNDGICVPLVILLLEVAVGTEVTRQPFVHIIGTVVEEIGIGLLVGAALAAPAAFLSAAPSTAAGSAPPGPAFPPWRSPSPASPSPSTSAAAASSPASWAASSSASAGPRAATPCSAAPRASATRWRSSPGWSSAPSWSGRPGP